MEPHLRHPMLVIKLIVMPCDKRKPGNTKIRVQIARNVSKNGVKTKRAALLHRDIYAHDEAKWEFLNSSHRNFRELKKAKEEALRSPRKP